MGNTTFYYRPRPRLETTRTHPLRKAIVVQPPRVIPWARMVVPFTLLVSLCVFGALFPWAEVDRMAGREDTTWTWTSLERTVPVRQVSARFDICLGAVRHTCVVDGDTIWLEGKEIRIADIDAPETERSGCRVEQELGLRATERLTQWLNAAPFEVHPNPDGRDEDVHGRQLRVLSRGGSSAVDALVAEGVAGRWTGESKRWC